MTQLADQPWLNSPTTRTLFAAFEAAGHELRFVGGCVRDALLGRAVGDLDAATPASPDAVMALLTAASIRAIPTGIEHGTITAMVDGTPYQITTLRRDVACDGRHAEVAFTNDWQQDAARRDFTMNALYCDATGTISDFFGGIADAHAGRVRFIGNAADRITEDALRILRFFRFNATHGAAPYDEAALAACHQLCHQLDTLSGERIQQEMFKLLAASHPPPALEAMAHSGVATALGCPDTLPTHSLAWLGHEALSPLPEASRLALLRLGLWLRHGDHAADTALRLAHRWKLSNEHRHWLHALTASPPLAYDGLITTLITLLRTHGAGLLPLLLLRDAAESQSDHSALIDSLEAITHLSLPTFPVSGNDLKALGFSEGKALGDMLKQLERHWEASGYTLAKDALLAPIRQSHRHRPS